MGSWFYSLASYCSYGFLRLWLETYFTSMVIGLVNYLINDYIGGKMIFTTLCDNRFYGSGSYFDIDDSKPAVQYRCGYGIVVWWRGYLYGSTWF